MQPAPLCVMGRNSSRTCRTPKAECFHAASMNDSCHFCHWLQAARAWGSLGSTFSSGNGSAAKAAL